MMTGGAATSAVGITTAAPTSASRPVAEAPGKTPNEEQLPAPTSPTAGPAALVLRIRSEAWIEVVQSDGATLLSQICAAGTVQTIKGTAPLRVVVGNSAGVEVQFRGAAVDLGRYTNPNGVARLTLE
ncbi:XRE family transcriptional regulator (fragment) [Burkholderiales bacterium]